MKKIAIIGVGGRTGTMFAFELRNSVEILGVGREKEVKIIRGGNLYLERKYRNPELFKERIILDTEFDEDFGPDLIFLTTKNPIGQVVKYYYQQFKDRIPRGGKTASRRQVPPDYNPPTTLPSFAWAPTEGVWGGGRGIAGGPTLLISQNGIAAIEDAKEVLKEIFEKESEKIRLIRIILFNPVDKKEEGDKIFIKYSLPIRIAMAKASGPGGIEDVVEIFKKSNFEVFEFPQKEAKNLEFSKLFLNLIGMAAASRGFSIDEGFKDKEIFREEIKALREYIKVVKVSGGKFLNFPHYPVKLLTVLFNLPICLLSIFRKTLAKLISEGRGGKPKDLDEIDYYNGGVVNLGKKLGIKTPINEKILKRVKERLS